MFSHQKNILISCLKDTHVVGNHLSLLGVVAHWIDSDSQACRALLGLCHLSSALTGENQG